MLLLQDRPWIGHVLKKLPPVPSTTPIYKTTLTTTTDQTATTFTAVDIGTPHPKRIVVLIDYMGVAVSVGQTDYNVNGYDAMQADRAGEVGMATIAVPNDTTATITVSHVGSTRKAVGVYIMYPADPLPMEYPPLTNTATTTTDAVVTVDRAMNKGCLLYGGCQHATLGTFTATWSGADAVTENVDAQIEATASYTWGIVNFTSSSNTNTLTLAESTSGTKRLIAATWGPAYGNF